ncbi:mCG1051121 [Mus musculus]|nr:mCG1051121 [Mus musculus]
MSCELHVSPGLACLAKDGRDRKQGECHSPAACFAVRVSWLPDGCGREGSANSESKGCQGQSGEGQPISQQLLP